MVTPVASMLLTTAACWRKSAVVSTQPPSARAMGVQISSTPINNRKLQIANRKFTSSPRPFSMEPRQIAIGHLEDDQCHRRGIVLSGLAVPRAVGLVLPRDQRVANVRIVSGPIFPAGQEH